MKKILLPLSLLAVLLGACSTENEVPELEYSIYQIAYLPSLGNVYVRDLGEGQLEIEININPIVEGKYPAHLHFGSINTVGELAYRLTDLDGATGTSRTVLRNVELSNGEILTYDNLLEMDGSIKVHMADAEFKDAVIAYGNIGRNDNLLTSGIAVCIGH